MHILPGIQYFKSSVPLLKIFADWVRSGVLITQGQPIFKQTVDKYICSVGEISVAVGAKVPRLNTVGYLYFFLGWCFE